MIFGIIAGSFITVFLLVLGLFSGTRAENSSINNRLKKISGKAAEGEGNEELSEPFFVRMLKPILDGVSKKIMRGCPKRNNLSL